MHRDRAASDQRRQLRRGYSALDLTTGKWSFDVTLYDDLATGLADAERVQIGFDDSALTLTGPGGCKERLSYRR